jgi:hypothetical protein
MNDTEALTPNQILVRAMKAHKPVSLTHGKYHPVLQALAQRHSHGQAGRDRHDRFYVNYAHFGWGERQIELVSRAPECKGFGEVCAFAGPGYDTEDAAKAIFTSWKGSPGHWVMVNGYYDYWGYAMAQGRSGVWYATGIVALKR